MRKKRMRPAAENNNEDSVLRNPEVAELRAGLEKADEGGPKKVKDRTHAARQQDGLLAGIIDIAADAIILIDESQHIILFNKGAEHIFGYDAREVLGRPLGLLLPTRFAESHRQHIENFSASSEISRLMDRRREISGRHKDGSEFPAAASIAKWSQNGKPFFLVLLQDITERKRAEETIRNLAFYDSITGLPNRTLLHVRIQEALSGSERKKKAVALLLMDLDRFREINDTLGHHRGDRVLQAVGARLKKAVRPDDFVARLGGDEFAILLPLGEPEHATLVAEKIHKSLEEPFAIDRIPIAVEASIGIALHPDHAEDAGGLIQRADIAMYTAKRSGRGFVLYESKLDQHSPRKLALMGELRQAIENEELVLYYQPKINLKTNRITGVEALVRWRHPKHGMIPPYEFIGPAEQSGLIKPLTLWVFNEAQRQCMTWHARGTGLRMSINLSTRNLQDPDLPYRIGELLKGGNVPADTLELEITESAIMDDPQRALEFITLLNTMGVRFSIDDFGTGYSSLAYLKKLPVDAIKIDQSFVKDMGTDEGNPKIVRSIIDLAHNLGLEVIAEGVETQAIYDQLAAMGCDSAQGFLMGKPLPPAELSSWLAESPWGLK